MLGHVVVELTNKNCGRCYGLFLEVLTLLNSLVAMTCRSDQTEELMQTGRDFFLYKIIIIKHQRLCGGAIYKFHYLHKFFKRSFYYFILIF